MGVQILNKDVSIISSIGGRAKASIGNVGGVTLAAATSITPNPTPNWANCSYNEPTNTSVVGMQQITGITQAITLSITTGAWTGTQQSLGYKVTTTAPTWANGGSFTVSLVGNGFTIISSGDTFTVNPNEYVSFGIIQNGVRSGSTTVTIRNVTDSNTILDTYVASVTV
jgi:hypothetical protein